MRAYYAFHIIDVSNSSTNIAEVPGGKGSFVEKKIIMLKLDVHELLLILAKLVATIPSRDTAQCATPMHSPPYLPSLNKVFW